MNVGDAAAFRTDLAKKAYEGTFELERELRATQKLLPPYAPECQAAREKLRKAYEEVIFFDFNFAHEQDVESLLWMKVHHKTIEAYRSHINKFQATHGKQKPIEFRKLVLHFTNFTRDAAKYYRAYIQRLIVHFRVTELHYVLQTFHMDLPMVEPTSNSFSAELTQLVKESCHATLIFLGDLSRYRELQAIGKDGKKDWGPALGYYQFARRLRPGAGKPMNQLAVIAIYTENVLNSSYFFMRAVCATEEFPTARENLALGFRKIVAKPLSLDTDAMSTYIYFIANIFTKDNFESFKLEQSSVLNALRGVILDRGFSSEVIAKMLTLSIGIAHVLSSARVKRDAVGTEIRKRQSIESITIAFIEVLLDLLLQELRKVKSDQRDLALQISPVMRSLLPSVRIAVKWVSTQFSKGRPLWNKYMKAMALLGSRFPRASLPISTYPLVEDIDLRGFSPLNSKLSLSAMEDAKTTAHPNVEALARLGDLLASAAALAQRIDAELSRTMPMVGAQPQVEDSAPVQAGSAIGRTLNLRNDVVNTAESHASEPSMAFSLNRMVDSLVGQTGDEEEEVVFKGRRNQ